jgi:hypothetical protein
LKSHRPWLASFDQMRAQFRRGRGASTSNAPNAVPAAQGSTTAAQGQQPAAQGSSATPSGEASQSATPPETRRGGRGGRGGRFFGGRDRGRINFSRTDTITFIDEVTIAPGFPELDYLHGDASGQSGGTPRHEVEARAGYFNNGLGARISANWRSGTTVNTLTGDNLHFSPLATFDLRLFANPGDIPEAVVKHPWLRGTQVRFEVENIFNARPKVHDAGGNVPLNFQPDLLDPLGRTIMISFRKSFLPSFAPFRRAREQEQQAQPPR